MTSVFLLFFHTRHLSNGEDDDKILEIYSSRAVAEKKIEELYSKLPGFRESDGEFIIDEYKIDHDGLKDSQQSKQKQMRTLPNYSSTVSFTSGLAESKEAGFWERSCYLIHGSAKSFNIPCFIQKSSSNTALKIPPSGS